MELRKFEDISEQQVNIIQSNQVELWLEEERVEMEELQSLIEELRAQIADQNSKIKSREKTKMERIIINPIDSSQRESRTLEKYIQDHREVIEKLRVHNEQQASILEKEQEAFADLVKDINYDVDELIKLDISANSKKYWNLTLKKIQLESQIKRLNNTVKE